MSPDQSPSYQQQQLHTSPDEVADTKLTRPVAIDEQLYPYKCLVPSCGRRYKRPVHLERHLKTHSPKDFSSSNTGAQNIEAPPYTAKVGTKKPRRRSCIRCATRRTKCSSAASTGQTVVAPCDACAENGHDCIFDADSDLVVVQKGLATIEENSDASPGNIEHTPQVVPLPDQPSLEQSASIMSTPLNFDKDTLNNSFEANINNEDGDGMHAVEAMDTSAKGGQPGLLQQNQPNQLPRGEREQAIVNLSNPMMAQAQLEQEKPKYIYFRDAVNRKYQFPYQMCQTWDGMERLIHQAFKYVDIIGPHVMEGRYDLHGPDGQIILPAIWDAIVQPDWSITMVMWPLPETPEPEAPQPAQYTQAPHEQRGTPSEYHNRIPSHVPKYSPPPSFKNSGFEGLNWSQFYNDEIERSESASLSGGGRLVPTKSASRLEEVKLPNANTYSDTRCICGYDHDDGFTIQCDRCNHWLHGACVKINPRNIPDDFICYYCEIRDLKKSDVQRARDLQSKRQPRQQLLQQSHPQQTRVVSSYWSVPENQDFRQLLACFGTNFEAIAEHLRTKTTTMVRNNYQRGIEQGKDYQRIAEDANRKIAAGEPLPHAPPRITPSSKRRYDASKAQAHAQVQANPQVELAAAKQAGKALPLDEYYCIIRTCEYHTRPIGTQADVIRHLNEDHPPKPQPPPDAQALREREVRLIEERSKMATNPFEHILDSVAEGLGLNRDRTEKLEEEKEEKDSKAPTPENASIPMSKTQAAHNPHETEAQAVDVDAEMIITPDDLEIAKLQINRSFDYVKAKVPKLKEQQLKRQSPSLERRSSSLSESEDEAETLIMQPEPEPEPSVTASFGRPESQNFNHDRLPTDSGYASLVPHDLKQVPYIQDTKQLHHTHLEPETSILETVEPAYAETIFSSTSSTATVVKGAYFSDLADALFDQIRPDRLDTQAVDLICMDLPDLLKAFALKLGCNTKSRVHHDIMYFVYRHHSDIIKYFREKCNHEEQEENTVADSQGGMSLIEKMELWNLQIGDSEPPVIENNLDDLDSDEDEPSLDLFGPYRNIISGDPAYAWLIGTLQRKLLLTPAAPNRMENIKDTILKTLNSPRKISKKRPAEVFSTTFLVHWDLLAFILEQGYEEPPEEAIEKVITLTGTVTDAQASTCLGYLRQTWPSHGDHILKLLKSLVYHGPGIPQTHELPDRATLTATLQDSELVIKVLGTRYSIAEIGEQLAWLGSALRSSRHTAAMSRCWPTIKHLNTTSHPQADLNLSLGRYSGIEHKFDIDFVLQEVEENDSYINGRCWHNMFRNPVIAEGFPIPRRSRSETGIEMPLEIIMGLAQADKIDIFNKKIFIKGFSTMLVPTMKEKDVILWHLLYRSNGARICYLENTIPHAENVKFSTLTTARHIIGWCTNGGYFAGARDASYNIEPSRLPKCDDGCDFRELFISEGHRLEGGHPFSIGNKDRPLRILRERGITPKLNWLRDKYVVLWDEGDKRGWLVNAASAWLHLLRASFEFDSANDSTSGNCTSGLLFKPENLKESSQPHTPFSAGEVLKNAVKLTEKIYLDEDEEEDEGCVSVKDRVNGIYDTLTKIIEYQIGVTRQIVNPSTRALAPRSQLEGWDFHDLATRRDPIFPRVTSIQPRGKGWIDFTRAIHAVSLFGRGFGEIIRPTSDKLCEYWMTLPAGLYYLAGHTYDLRNIMRLEGDERAAPMRLVNKIIWQNPGTDFEQCICQTQRSAEHSDPVQVLLPSKFETLFADKRPIQLIDDSAVIFGHNANFQWIWRDFGDPEEGELAALDEASQMALEDSGVGSSLTDPSSSNLSLGLTSEDYKIGIVCALQKELLAIRALFDAEHDDIPIHPQDSNYYALGLIGQHNVVAACLPAGEYGTCAAADVIAHMTRSFSVEFCLLVGIGGGIPSVKNDIRLGDVVVSCPGVVQYDLGKARQQDDFESTGSLQRPPRFMMKVLSKLASDPRRSSQKAQIRGYIDKIIANHPSYKSPGQNLDTLFAAASLHKSDCATCIECDKPTLRTPRLSEDPEIHYGVIASGNQVIKDARFRDELDAKYNAICVEMEAAGVISGFPCLVIRGICDYSDSHKNKEWQEYAAATAAAYAKFLLSVVRSSKCLDKMAPETADNCMSTVSGMVNTIKRRQTGTSLPPPIAKRQRQFHRY